MQTEIDVLKSPTLHPYPDRQRIAALRSLQRQVNEEVSRWAIYADQEISNAALREIAAGLADSRNLVTAHFTNPRAQAAIGARFDMLAPEQVETMLGFLADDSPLHDALVNRLGPELAKRMGETLEEGIALGYNPRKMAALAQQQFGIGLQWALTTARTSALWSYREASRANYVANSDVVVGWIWWAEIASPRTCMSCLAKHGSRHDANEVLNDHHNGRCASIPIVPLATRLGLSAPKIEDGEDWFNRQPEAVQKARMGPGKWEAWKAGEFTFDALSTVYHDHVYGDMWQETTLTGLVGSVRQKEILAMIRAGK